MSNSKNKAPTSRMIPIDALIPYANNARTHSAEQIEKLRASLREFGFVSPCLVDGDNNIIAGHGRVEAAKLEGMTEVPCVLVEHLTDEQRRAYILADNRLAELAGWDEQLLKIELQELAELDFDISFLGFEVEVEVEEGEVTEDEFDTDAALGEVTTAITKRGDIWQLGNHRLMCGDSTSKNDVDKLMGGNKARMCVTDPPWNVAIGMDSNPRHRQREGLINDNMSSQEFGHFLDGWVRSLSPHLKGDMYCVLGASEWPQLDEKLRGNGYHWSATIIWQKDAFVLGRSNYHRRYEPIWYGWQKGQTSSFNGERNLDDVWEFKRPRVSKEHPTMKPVDLIAEAVKNSSKTGDIVADVFGGSGTTLIACEQLNRTCYMMELDEKYCDVIIKRWEALTGGEAVIING